MGRIRCVRPWGRAARLPRKVMDRQLQRHARCPDRPRPRRSCRQLRRRPRPLSSRPARLRAEERPSFAYSVTAGCASRARSRQARHAASYAAVCVSAQPPAVGGPYSSRRRRTSRCAAFAACCLSTSSSKVCAAGSGSCTDAVEPPRRPARQGSRTLTRPLTEPRPPPPRDRRAGLRTREPAVGSAPRPAAPTEKTVGRAFRRAEEHGRRPTDGPGEQKPALTCGVLRCRSTARTRAGAGGAGSGRSRSCACSRSTSRSGRT